MWLDFETLPPRSIYKLLTAVVDPTQAATAAALAAALLS
jgi:hypothetical protein